MANHEANGKKAKHGSQLTARWRGAVLNAFDAVEKEGKLISEILAEEFKKNPIKFMELASKGLVTDINTNITDNSVSRLSETEINAELAEIRQLAGVLAAERESIAGKPEEAGSKEKIH